MPRKQQKLNIPEGACAFCGIKCEESNSEELRLGQVLSKFDMKFHYFCMLFSSALRQNGNPRQGALGFLERDVMKELRRGLKLRCCYCKRNGATIGCSIGKCCKKFHLPCGQQEGSLHQFFGEFKSFCVEHRPRQELPLSDRLSFHGTANTTCPICLCAVEARSSNYTLRAPCCKNSWFHRTCVQEQAVNAGYFFKCPMCNDVDTYKDEMMVYGIYIPEKDASWELESNAYGELLYRHNRCDHNVCKCPDGNDYNKDGRWEVILCTLCGSQGCHISCGRLSFYQPYWECYNCRGMLKSFREQKDATKTKKAAERAEHEAPVASTSSSPSSSSTSASSSRRKQKTPRKQKTADDQIVERIHQCKIELRGVPTSAAVMDVAGAALLESEPEFLAEASEHEDANDQAKNEDSESEDVDVETCNANESDSEKLSGSDVDVIASTPLKVLPPSSPKPVQAITADAPLPVQAITTDECEPAESQSSVCGLNTLNWPIQVNGDVQVASNADDCSGELIHSKNRKRKRKHGCPMNGSHSGPREEDVCEVTSATVSHMQKDVSMCKMFDFSKLLETLDDSLSEDMERSKTPSRRKRKQARFTSLVAYRRVERQMDIACIDLTVDEPEAFQPSLDLTVDKPAVSKPSLDLAVDEPAASKPSLDSSTDSHEVKIIEVEDEANQEPEVIFVEERLCRKIIKLSSFVSAVEESAKEENLQVEKSCPISCSEVLIIEES